LGRRQFHIPRRLAVVHLSEEQQLVRFLLLILLTDLDSL